MKTFSDIYERVKSADKKPQKYKDEKGRERVRMVSTDDDIVKESHFKVGQKVKCKASGMTGEVIKVDPEEKGKYYTVRQDSGKVMKYAPDELTAVMKEEFAYRDMSDTGGDEEVQMAVRQLHFIEYAAQEIMEYVEMRGDLDEWFQNKLANAHMKMQGLHSYIEGDKRAMGMDMQESLKKDIASLSSKYPEGSDVTYKGKRAKVLSVGKDHVVVAIGNKTHTAKPSELQKESVMGNNKAASRLAKRAAEKDAAGKSRRLKPAPLKLSPKAQQAMDRVKARNKAAEKGNYKESVEGTRILSEPATSKAQQQAAGAALAAKRGDVDPSSLKGASKQMYDSMSKKELEDFASTKHKGLPTRKEENELGVLIPMEYDENNNLIPKQEGSALWDVRKRFNSED